MHRSRAIVEDTILTPKSQGTNDGQSLIKLSGLSFKRPEHAQRNHGADEGFTGLVEVVVFERTQKHLVGYEGDEGWQYCCTEEWAKRTKCQPNHVYIGPKEEPVLSTAQEKAAPGGATTTPDTPPAPPAPAADVYAGFPWRAEVDFMNDDAVTSMVMDDTIQVNQTGVYQMWFFVCDPDLAEVQVRGRTVWKNPRGYLPGASQPLLPFFASLSMMHIILGITWLSLHFANTPHMFAQQHFITLSVTLGMLESCIDYADYYSVNASGTRLPALIGAAVLVGAMHKSSIRLAVLLLSKGFGTMRPSGVDRASLLLVGSHFAASVLLDGKLMADSLNDNTKVRLAYVVPVAIVEAAIVVAVAAALRNTLAHIRSKGSSVRGKMYTIFSGCLATLLLITLGYMGAEEYFQATHSLHEKWQYEWMHATFWHLMHLTVVAVLCMLWAPGELVSSYIYREVFDEEASAASAVSLVESGMQPGKSE